MRRKMIYPPNSKKKWHVNFVPKLPAAPLSEGKQYVRETVASFDFYELAIDHAVGLNRFHRTAEMSCERVYVASVEYFSQP